MFTRGGIVHFPARFSRSLTASWSFSLYTIFTTLSSLHLPPLFQNSSLILRFSSKYAHTQDGAIL